MGDYSEFMDEIPPEGVTPFVFSDPSGKRWPRLRLIDAFCRAENERAFFPAAVKRSTESVAKGESGWPIVSGFAAMEEIWRGATSGKKARRLSPHASAAAAEEIARQ